MVKRIVNISRPSVEQVECYLKRWKESKELNDYREQEVAIDILFHGEFKSNNDLQNILIKCSVLNDFYSTNIFKIFPVAKHILELNIDERLNKADPSLVNDIALVHIDNKTLNFYSFASKYCSHHYKDEYPIYDSYICKILKHFRDVDHFDSFKESDLKIYSRFKEIIIRFRERYKLTKYTFKQLDMYLWQLGKEYFNKYKKLMEIKYERI